MHEKQAKCIETQHKFVMRGQEKGENGVRFCRGKAHDCSKKLFISCGLLRLKILT